MVLEHVARRNYVTAGNCNSLIDKDMRVTRISTDTLSVRLFCVDNRDKKKLITLNETCKTIKC